MTQTEAALWVDGRYHLQADKQTDDNWLVMKQGKTNYQSSKRRALSLSIL